MWHKTSQYRYIIPFIRCISSLVNKKNFCFKNFDKLSLELQTILHLKSCSTLKILLSEVIVSWLFSRNYAFIIHLCNYNCRFLNRSKNWVNFCSFSHWFSCFFSELKMVSVISRIENTLPFLGLLGDEKDMEKVHHITRMPSCKRYWMDFAIKTC